ncbi:effector-associated constant component EACC1 [Actinokineospora cianjurensis]|uniref:Uncharacterized protein n=1 Tax=Actinokineospora cianjurensis TaxID=585224 RepID=A0A421AW47_9PSEU|nr:esterase-like activity of phytase family protein [Actinokineospora cianjurensis]RLK53956.1 hypothetical protein CLV68_6338 [Actinokineospora cianjurensis]
MDTIEFRFEAGSDDGGPHDDLRTLSLHLADDDNLRKHGRVLLQREPVRPGELGAAEVVLAAVSAVVGVGQLAVAVRAWRDELNRPTSIRLVVPEKYRDNARAVFEALHGSEAAQRQPDPATVNGKLVGRIDPANSACVLIGVDRYDNDDLPSLRAVYNNIEQLYDVLTDDKVWGIDTDRIRKVHHPRTPAELIRPIREMTGLATDTLIVYYAGHGLKDLEENELYLALPGSVPGQPETSVRYKAVKQAIAQSRHAQRVIVILDCCYSGVAMDGAMSQAVEDMRADAGVDDVRGSYLMCSAAPNRKALAPDPDKCTVFTAALVDVLRDGIPEEPDPTLSLGVVFREVRRRLRRDSRPEPQEQDRNQVGDVPFTRNTARIPLPAAVEPPPPRRGLARRALVIAAATVVGIGVGMAVRPGIDLVRELNPVAAGGPCSANTTLLSYSDQLNGTDVSGESVTGLSALAMTGDSKGYALADNNPGRVFPLALNDPEHLTVSAEVGRTLRNPANKLYPDGFDGEGLVVERGEKTLLVSSEKGPTIRRYDIDTGREVGPPIAVPERLLEPPLGTAQYGRTIESLTATPDGKYLYAGWEAPLSGDGDTQGRNRLRIQRYQGTAGGAYTTDYQYAYETDSGLYLAELAVVGENRLLALERQYVDGLGNSIRIFDVRLDGAPDVTRDDVLSDNPADTFVRRTLLFDLANCPAGSPGQVTAKQRQPNPLLDNVEGMAVRPEDPNGARLLYLISDNNNKEKQVTRVYALRVKLPS